MADSSFPPLEEVAPSVEEKPLEGDGIRRSLSGPVETTQPLTPGKQKLAESVRTRLRQKNNGFRISLSPVMTSVKGSQSPFNKRRGVDWSWVQQPGCSANDVSKALYAYTVLADFFEQCLTNGMPDDLYSAYKKAVEDMTSAKMEGIDAEAKHLAGDEHSVNILASAGVMTEKQIADLVPLQGPIELKEFISQEECLHLFKERVMEKGQLKRKTQSAMIRPAVKGERVVTIVDGKTTSDTVVTDCDSWVVKAPTAWQEEYVLSAEKFAANWDVDEMPTENATAYPNRRELEKEGFKLTTPKLVLKWMYKIEEADLKLLPSHVLKTDWGVKQEIKTGDYFVVPYPESRAKEVYMIPQQVVCSVYENCDEDDFLLGSTQSSTDARELQTEILQSTLFDRTTRGNTAVDVGIVMQGFRDPFNLLYRYQIDEKILCSWLQAIAAQYKPVEYHSWSHAFDVFQFLYLSLTVGESSTNFSFQDILALLLAALSHDVGHMGTTNAFLISTQHDLAIKYNDKSPLENLHSSVFFETLRKPGLNFLGAMSQDKFRDFRKKVVDSILATDMSHHFELIDSMSVAVAKTKEKRRVSVDRSASESTLLLQAFMHTSDLGHCCRPFSIHRNIVVLLEEEFFKQGDQERALGMPISPMMDRTKDSAASGQSFFLTKLFFPLIDPYTHFLDSDYATTMKVTTQENIDKWVALCQKYMPPGADLKTAKAIVAAEG